MTNSDGTFPVDFSKIKDAVRSLTGDLLTIEAEGDYARAKKMLEQLAVLRPNLKNALDRLQHLPVDINPGSCDGAIDNAKGTGELESMSLDIQQREREGILILDLKGRLVVGEPIASLRERIRELGESGRTNVILNLQDVDYIDSTGLGGLVISYTTLKKAGGAFKVVNLSRRNIELLVLTKLSTVFEMFNDEQDAVNSFFPNREIKKFDILAFVQQQNESDK